MKPFECYSRNASSAD